LVVVGAGVLRRRRKRRGRQAGRTPGAYSAPDRFTDLTANDTLTGDPVLPGFALPLARLFAELDRRG
jgi:hypothetical protein